MADEHSEIAKVRAPCDPVRERLDYAPRTSRLLRHRRALLAGLFLVLLPPAVLGTRWSWKRFAQYRAERQRRLDHSLILAACKGDVSAVRAKLRAGAHVDAQYGWTSEEKLPVRFPVFYFRRGLTALMVTAFADCSDDARLDVARTLIEAGADVNAPAAGGGTALYYAVELGREKLALYFLDHGADPNVVNDPPRIDGPGQRTPLFLALDMPAVLKALLARGANVHARDSDSETPLSYALRWNHPAAIGPLAHAGADLNADMALGEPPLHWAARDRNVEAVRVLLANGADANVVDPEDGCRPLHRVEYSRERFELERKHGGTVDDWSSEGLESALRDLNDNRSEEEKQIAALLRKAGAR